MIVFWWLIAQFVVWFSADLFRSPQCTTAVLWQASKSCKVHLRIRKESVVSVWFCEGHAEDRMSRFYRMCYRSISPRNDTESLLLPCRTLTVRQWLCGRVPDLQSGGCGFESQHGLLRTKVYSAFHPSGVGKWVPAVAGKAKAGMAHSDCRWMCGCAGKTVKSLENKCHTWALLRWWFTTKRCYIKCMDLYL